METNLRPLTLGEILDRTAQLYRSNFFLFVGISAVYAGVVLVLNLTGIGLGEALRIAHLTERLQWLTFVTAGVTLLVTFLSAGIAVAANNRAVAWVHLGEPATIRGAYLSILPQLGRYLWLMTIAFLIVWLPVALLYAGYFGMIALYLPKGFMAHPDTSNQKAMLIFGAGSLIFVLLLIPAAVYATLMGLRYSLAVPACVVEDLKARAALRRSIDLSKGARGRIFVLGLLVAIIEIGLVAVTQAFFIVMAVKHHQQLPVWLRILQQFVGFLTNAFIGPMYATGLTLFYYDQRVRKEGYDIEWMMHAAGLTPPAFAPAVPDAAGAESWPSAGAPALPSSQSEPGEGRPRPPEEPGESA
jgi:hypothetical protein